MQFKNLDELIACEQAVEWHDANKININDYKFEAGVKAKLDRIKGRKKVGIYNNKVISVISDQFKPISVKEIAEISESLFGSNYTEKSYKEGIIRIHQNGIEDKRGKVMPMVVYPPNFGNMAVRVGLYHYTYICSNGLMIGSEAFSDRIIHRSNHLYLENRIKKVGNNLELILKKVDQANSIELEPGVQLAMIILGLKKNDGLIKAALSNYPSDCTLWETIQSITSIATHKTKQGYEYAVNAGEFLVNPKLEPYQVVEAASYALTKASKDKIKFEQGQELYAMASDLLSCIQ